MTGRGLEAEETVKAKAGETQTPGWHSGTAIGLGSWKLLEGTGEACGKGVRVPPTLSPGSYTRF